MNLEKKAICIVNLVIGFSLWFFSLTNWSIIGTYADYFYPVFALVISVISTRILLKKEITIGKSVKLSLLPSRVGGMLQLSYFAILLIPIFWMQVVFGITEINNEIVLEKEYSPNKLQTAYVYFRPVGAYAPGSGHTYVRVRNLLIPLLEHDIFTESVSGATEDTKNYITWISNHTLHITEAEGNGNVNTNKILFEFPDLLAVPLFIIYTAVSLFVYVFHLFTG